MNASGLAGFLFPAIISLVWLVLEARLACQFSRIKKRLAATDGKKA